MSAGSGSGGPSGSSRAVNIPFSFAGCSSPPLPSTSAAHGSAADASSLLSKSGAGLTVRCPPRSQRVSCLLRLARPCRVTRLIARNAGSVFLQVRSTAAELPATADLPSPLSAAALAALCGSSGWCELIPEHQLCAAEVWRSSQQSQQPLTTRVHSFPSAGAQLGSFSPQLAHTHSAALWLDIRGAEDEWSREATIGLSWLEVFGVPVEQ